MVVVSTNQSQNTEFANPQSLVERVEQLETRERVATEQMIIRVKMGIRQLDNRRTVDHKEFISTAEKLILEITTLKNDFNQSLEKQASHSKQLVEETYTVYESGLAVLQNKINGLRCSLTAHASVDEILRLTKEIYQLYFKKEIHNNLQVCDQINYKFNETFQRIDGLKQWFEEQQEVGFLFSCSSCKNEEDS